jgi:nucleoside-diphosphate-sugar epimerase
MRIAVTGASGFIGGVLARRLAGQGHTVFAFGRRQADKVPASIPNYKQWDLLAGSPGVPEIDALIHCAAKVGDWGKSEDYRMVNVEGTRTVMETFRHVDRFVYVSSASVYSGDQPERCLTEDASVGSELFTAYARSKAEAEKLLLSSGRDVVILRPHIVYGPGDPTLLPRLLAARKFGWLPVPGDGSNHISVTHILNFAHAVERVLDSQVMNGIFNIADAEPAHIDDLLHTFMQRNGVEVRLLHVPRRLAWGVAVVSEWLWRIAGSSHAPRLTRYLVAQVAGGHTLNLARAVTILGYSPRHNYHNSYDLGGFA